MNATFPRLYAILDTDFLSARRLDPIPVLTAWLESGVRLVQLRAKSLASGEMLELADQMQELVSRASGRLIVNDRADVARMSRAAGIHVGQEDLTIRDVRTVVGPDAVVGLSTHNVDQVESAIQQPISYLAIGPIFQTSTKGGPIEAPVDLRGVRDAAELAAAPGIPLVAIGGITLARAREILDAGAASVAVISDLLLGDPAARAREYVRTLA